MTNDSFDPPVVVAIYRAYLSFAPLRARFPKPHRYTLGDAIDRKLLVLLDLVFEANAVPRPLRESPLVRANAACETARLLVRMSFELKLIDSTQYFQLTAALQEIGRMLGGWIKFVRNGPYGAC